MRIGYTLSGIASDLTHVQTQVAACAPGSGTAAGAPWTGRAGSTFGDRLLHAHSRLTTARWALEAAAEAAYRHEALMRALRAAMAGTGGVG